jgi:hypothetical protein
MKTGHTIRLFLAALRPWPTQDQSQVTRRSTLAIRLFLRSVGALAARNRCVILRSRATCIFKSGSAHTSNNLKQHDCQRTWTQTDERSPLIMSPPTFSCPRCKCKAVVRAHRRGLDWLISVLGFRPARCFTCNRRFYMRHSLVKAQQ